MPRDLPLEPPTRGLSIVRPPARLGTTECCRAENVNFTTTHVRRRKGRQAAYSFPNAASSTVMGLARFYDLAVTGTVTKKFFISTSVSANPLWCPTSDWSDDTATVVSAFTEQKLPNTTDDTLYAQYAAGPVTQDQTIRTFVQAHSWMYMCPNLPTSSLTSNIANQPMRSQGDGKVYLMGLVPPAALAGSDVSTVGIPAGASWAVQTVLTTTAAGANRSQLARDRLLPDRYGFAYKDATTTSLTVALYDPTAATEWTFDIVTGPIVPLGAIRTMDFSFDLAGFMCVLYVDNVSFDLMFAFKEYPATAGVAVWRIETVAAGTFTQCSMTIDDQNIVHVVANAAGPSFNYYKRDQQGAWSAAEVIVAAAVNFPVVRCRRDTYVPRVVYINAANTDVLYRQRDSGAWSAAETVKTGAAALLGSHMCLDSTNIPHVSWADTTNSDVLYSNRTSGAWPAAQTVDSNAVAGDTFIDLNPDNLVGVSYDDYPGGFATGESRLATLESGTWFTAAVAQPALASSCPSFLMEEDNTIHGLTGRQGVNNLFLTGTYEPYFYKLTAEYDGGILGESGPSAATGVIRRTAVPAFGSQLDPPIAPYAPHTLNLNGPATYNMTSDVTKIHIYRTLRGGSSTSTYYRVGSQACDANGAPTTDFIDSVTDAELVAPTNKILDADKYLPPRWKTAAYWKDRMVIGGLLCRDTDDTTQLDYEQDGIHKNRVRFSAAFTPDVYRANFFQDIVPDGGSGSIQKLIVNPVTDMLYVLMENDVVALVGSPLGDKESALSFPMRNVAGSKGTPSRFSVLQYDGRIFYWTKHGIEMIYGLEGRDITSDTIGKLWGPMVSGSPGYADRIDMTALSRVCGAPYVDSVGERILWAYSSSGSSANDRILCLHYGLWKHRGYVGDPPYSIYTGWGINCFGAWDGEGDRGELFGGEDLASLRAWTYRLEFGNEDEIGTSGSQALLAIQPWYVWTALYDGGRPDLRKAWEATRLTGKSGTIATTYPVEIILDVEGGGLTPTIDTISWVRGSDRMYLRALPRVAIADRCGLRIKGTDALEIGGTVGPESFELYGLGFTLNDLRGRVRGSG